MHKSRLRFAVGLVLLVAGGALVAEFQGDREERGNRDMLARELRVVSAGLNGAAVGSVEGTATDMDGQSAGYARLRRQMIAMGDYAGGMVRRVYLMGMREGQVVFTVDSSPEGSPDHRAPGVVHEWPLDEVLQVFHSGTIATLGPHKTPWGEFVSGYTALRNPASGRIVGVLGIDIDAREWRTAVMANRLGPMALTLLVILITVGGFALNLRIHEDSATRRKVEGSLYELEHRCEGLTHVLERYAALARHSRDIFLFVRQEDGRIMDGNSAAEKAYGYSAEELRRMSVADLRAPAQRAEAAAQLAAADERGVVFETVHRARDGREFPVEVSACGVYIGTERVIVSIIRDVSERVKSQFLLQESQRREASILATVPDPAWLKDTRGRLLAVNAAWRRFVGCGDANVVGRMMGEFFTPSMAATIAIGDSRVVHEEGYVRSEEQMADASGQMRWFDTITTRVVGPGGEVLGIAGIARDITDRKRAQSALAESEQFLRAIFDNAADGILIGDGATRKLRAGNPRICEMLGYTPAEIEQLQMHEVHPEEARAGFEESIRQRLRGETAVAMDVPMKRKDGSIFCADLNAFAIQIGGRQSVVGIFRDVSDRHRAKEQAMWYESRLRAMAMEASLAGEQERRELSGLLHDDVCQLLAVAKMRLAVQRKRDAAEGASTEQLQAITEIIDRADRSARSLMLQMSHPALYDLGLAPAVEWLAEDMQRLYGLCVHVHAAREINPAHLRTRVVLFQCLRELLVNAAKHAKVNECSVTLTREGDVITTTVEDDGVGFVPDQAERRSDGHGYGLFSISERLRSMGGTLRIQSQPQQGTTITLVVPLSPDTAATAEVK